MNPEQHANLCQAVAGFKQQFLECLDRGYESIEEDLVAWRQTVQTRIQQKFAHVEELLAGPYNRELTWDWVPDDREFDDIATFVTERRVRLREDPTLEMSGKEYFDKYARGGLGLLQVLESAGYYAPPTNKFFQPFCKQLLEGAKTLLRRDEVAFVVVPPDQVDLAFSKAQEVIAADQRLQRYCPLGIPVLRLDKEFYLNVVNTLVGLPYKVVLPLTDAENRSSQDIRQLLLDADKGLGAAAKLRTEVRVLGQFVDNVDGGEVEASSFLQLVEDHQKRVRDLQDSGDIEHLERPVLVSLPWVPHHQHAAEAG